MNADDFKSIFLRYIQYIECISSLPFVFRYKVYFVISICISV